MNQHQLRELIAAVRAGRVSRRTFVRHMVGLGLTAPLANQLLANAGLAQTAGSSDYKPTKAGGGGALKALLWQGPTLLNPHFAVGSKDQEGSRIFYEPLAAWNSDGDLMPVLAAEIPEVENGGVAPDGTSVTWKLKKDILWHDGRRFTADDVVFNSEYAADPATAAATIGSYQDVTVEKIDPFTVASAAPVAHDRTVTLISQTPSMPRCSCPCCCCATDPAAPPSAGKKITAAIIPFQDQALMFVLPSFGLNGMP